MKIICAWCKKIIKERKEPDEKASHGIYPECYDKELAKLKKEEKYENLNWGEN